MSTRTPRPDQELPPTEESKAYLPTFRNPETETEATPARGRKSPVRKLADRAKESLPPNLNPFDGNAPTATSGTEPTRELSTQELKLAASLGAGIVGLIATGIAMLIKSRATFREPTSKEGDAIGEPLGRIIARRVPAAVRGQDLADAVAAAAATGHYLKQGPVLSPAPIKPGMPANLNQETN